MMSDQILERKSSSPLERSLRTSEAVSLCTGSDELTSDGAFMAEIESVCPCRHTRSSHLDLSPLSIAPTSQCPFAAVGTYPMLVSRLSLSHSRDAPRHQYQL